MAPRAASPRRLTTAMTVASAALAGFAAGMSGLPELAREAWVHRWAPAGPSLPATTGTTATRSVGSTSVRTPAKAPAPASAPAPAPTASPGDIAGSATVVDGDTLVVRGIPVRLAGIDAPETDQTCLDAAGHGFACGIAARDHLSALLAGRPVSCAVSGGDSYGRALATCRAGPDDLNQKMVADGYALSYVQYSHARDGDEAAARERRAGLWSGAFVAPWDWRHRTERTTVLGATSVPVAARSLLLAPQSARGAPDPACLVKGNVSQSGERIYHLPGQRHYADVRMDKGIGERWFCSEAEAQAAGWRRAAR